MNTARPLAALESVALAFSAMFARADLLDAEPLARTAAEAFRALAAAHLAAGQLADADKARAIAEALAVRAEGLGDNLAALAPIAEGRRIRDVLAALPSLPEVPK